MEPLSISPNENPTTIWARIFVDELVQAGLAAVCISPGSRSTPLALAFYAHKDIKIHLHLDERSSAFFALGIALATEKPVALVCTSGTAAANFYPAIIEAKMSQVPLLILTADRPHELRQSGANQTINQVNMFGEHVLWSVDMALPQADAPREAIANLRALAARALALCDGFTKGPIHLNFPFRKPLEPTVAADLLVSTQAEQPQRPYTTIARGVVQPSARQLDYLARLVNEHPRGLIVCGPRCPTGNFPMAVAHLAEVSGYPILADPLSGLRFGNDSAAAAVLGGYESFLQTKQDAWPKPDLVLRFGSVPTSKWLIHYLVDTRPGCHIHVQESGKWADQNHTTTHLFQLNPTQLCQQISLLIERPLDAYWVQHWTQLEARSWAIVNNHLSRTAFDGSLAAALVDLLPPDAALFSGNSLAVRHIDQFGQPQSKSLRLFANRGASGIDGNISTGLGIAASNDKLTVILIGDITFYHDSNGLLALKKLAAGKVIIVLLNNNGGGIFRRLPVANISPPFEELFLTPHALDFAHIAAMYGLSHHIAVDLNSFRAIFETELTNEHPTIIEFQSDSRKDEQVRQQIINALKSQLNSA